METIQCQRYLGVTFSMYRVWIVVPGAVTARSEDNLPHLRLRSLGDLSVY